MPLLQKSLAGVRPEPVASALGGGEKLMHMSLLGEFSLRSRRGKPILIASKKNRALLAVLALSPNLSASRDYLANLLWSDRDDEHARSSLRQSLAMLRKELGEDEAETLAVSAEAVSLVPHRATIDAVEFLRLAQSTDEAALQQAVELYRGELLSDLVINDSQFEEWLAGQRQRLQQLMEQTLTGLLARSMAVGNQDHAFTAAKRLIALDPLNETACRALMQLHAERAQTAQALKIYESLRDRLHRELAVKPEPMTVELHEAIRQHRPMPHEPSGDASLPQSVLPSKPSIAVLPFQNLSGDPEQEYFADGIVEEIITALSRMHWLFVIARNSSFIYKNRAVDVKQIGRELGVRYVLEGSVRKAGNRIRITGQLVDTSTGVHLWADRFEGALADIFDLQDQVTMSVVGAIAPKLEQAELERSRHKPTESLDAYDYYLRGMASLRKLTREGNVEALSYFGKAIELDAEFATAYGMAARCYVQRKAGGWMIDPQKDIREAVGLARRAVELARDDAVALAAAGFALSDAADDPYRGNTLIDRALELNPNLAWAWLYSGWVKISLGQPDAGIERVKHSMRLSPNDPQSFSMQCALATAHLSAGRYDEALSGAEKAVAGKPDFLLPSCIAAASAALGGRFAEAQKAIDRLQEINPSLRISNIRHVISHHRAEDIARWEEGLRLAGLPD
jgi:TolB-like protein/DNA-binding SARP family transcriptional activator